MTDTNKSKIPTELYDRMINAQLRKIKHEEEYLDELKEKYTPNNITGEM